MLLTDEEIENTLLRFAYDPSARAMPFAKYLIKAQLKKLVEWGNEPCNGENHWGTIYEPPKLKRECPDYWQDLLGEVK